MSHEARLEDTESGLAPASPGWFVVNVRDAAWRTHRGVFGSACRFESRDVPFEQLGINIRVLEPGQSNCLYHRENLQEAYLVLAGECRLLVDGEERPMQPWDFAHLPPGTDHVMVGAGDGPSIVLMVGARSDAEELLYPVSELAARYGASAEEETPDPAVAYAKYPAPTAERPDAWDSLPWG
jgi:uncharacterized cupin superfamily protein